MGNGLRVAPLCICHGTPVEHASVKLGLPVGSLSLEEFTNPSPDVVQGRLPAGVEERYDIYEARHDTCRKRFVISVLALTGIAAATMGALRMIA